MPFLRKFALALAMIPVCACVFVPGVLAQEIRRGSSVYGTVVQDHVPSSSPSIESTLRKELERAGILVEKNTSIAQASAGVDKFALIGEKVIFDGSLSSVPMRSRNVRFEWDFGDGSTGEGLRVVHIYKRAGNYRAKLTITVDGNVSRDEVVVSVYEKQVLLISDQRLASESLSAINAKIRAEKTDLKLIRQTGRFPSVFMASSFLSDRLHKEARSISNADMIFSYDILGLMALSRFQQKSGMEFSDKTLVLINPYPEVYTFQKRFIQLLFNQLKPKRLLIVGEDFSYSSLLVSDYEGVFVINEADRGPGLMGSMSLLFAGLSVLLGLGFSSQMLYLILSMVLVTILCLIAKRIVGFNSIDVFMSSLAILSILFLGLVPGLISLFCFLIMSFLIHSGFYIRQLIAIPWNVAKYVGIAVMILVGLCVMHLVYPSVVLSEGFFPLLVLAFVADVVVYRMMNKPLNAVLIELFQEVLLIIAVVFLMSWTVIWQMMLGYPEMYVFSLLILGLFVERYSGLRLSELSEFRSLISERD